MAILSKIRDRSLFLIIIIGLALFAFVASPDTIMKFFSSNKANSVGSINGKHISIEEFNSEVEAYKNKFGDVNNDQATKMVWEELVANKIFDDQLDKANVVTGEKDVWNAIISDPSINSSPMFINESGLFDEELLKSYIAEMKEDDTADGKRKWAGWLSFDNDVAKNVRRQTYFKAVSAGMGYTLEEAKAQYDQNNTRVTGKYVFLPFYSVSDSLVEVSEQEIAQYVNSHKDRFKTHATRNIRFVDFPVEASAEDRMAIEEEIKSLIGNREVYDKTAQDGKRIEVGLKDTEDASEFIAEYSDLPESKNYVFEGEVADTLFTMDEGTLYGPYEEGGYYKISKIIEKKQVPEAQAAHILISFKETGNPNAKLTKDEAKAKAESLMAKVKAGADFAQEAQTNSEDPGSATRGGDLGWFIEGRMVPEFNDWVFAHKKGDIGMVETQYGFHIIKLNDTRSKLGLKVATVARKINPSDKTLNDVFIEAESFASAIQKDPKDFAKIAEERGLNIRYAENLSRGTGNINGITSPASQVSYWSFNQDTDKGDAKRFDLEKSYVVAQLTGIQEEGIMTPKSATSRVKPILMNKKKAEVLLGKLKSGSFEDIAQAEGTQVIDIEEATLLDPPPALSYDKSVIAAMTQMEESTILRHIVGKNGVYAVQLDRKMEPAALPSYESTRYQMQQAVRANDMSIYNALKEASDVGELKL